MSKVPVQFVIAAFNNEETADNAANALKRERVPYKNLAVIRKTADGKAKIKETGDLGGGAGAVIGAVIGGGLGLLLGPPGLAAGAAAGAAIGGAGAALHDAGIPNERLEKVGNLMKPSSSALIAIFEQVRVDKEAFEEIDQGAAEFVESLAEDIKANLDAGQDVAYAAAITSEGVVGKKVVVGEEAADIRAFAVTEEGVVAGEVVVTEDAVAYEVAASTEDAAAVEAGVVTEEGAVITGAIASEDEAVAGAAVITPEEDDASEEEKEK